jgi:hypothetical protein
MTMPAGGRARLTVICRFAPGHEVLWADPTWREFLAAAVTDFLVALVPGQRGTVRKAEA